MRKLLLIALLFVATMSANAQFEQGKWFVNAGLTGLDLSYSKQTKGHFGLDAGGGYFIKDNIAILAELGGDWSSPVDKYKLAAKGRYYFDKIGIFAGAGLKLSSLQYKGQDKSNDFALIMEGGYAYFLSRTVTIEPSIYWDLSFRNSDYTAFGLKLGFSFYF
ncbi:outer membrane beta-barrel protein [Bacteroides propionicifaciens]|uniref:outer membrane beta-barrel protein n=1 Tax=Bacteroides propionicifaciens TaxID=392838 RepID=UPI00046948FC|nr:outer membrane beta-barrel protein [Bacteroides propionicifaciens]